MAFAFAAHAQAADRIILRNLELIADRTIVAVDEDGARLDAPRPGGGDRLTWDEIERGRVSEELQEDFDRLKAELGPPLYKLRLRLRIGDYAGLTEPAEALYPRFRERRSQTAYLVCQSLMWSRLASGERERAVEPFLRCVVLLRSGAASAQRLPGSRQLHLHQDDSLCGDLPPVWLDESAATDVLPSVRQLIKELPMPRPEVVYLYYASLASQAGEFEEATKVLDAIEPAKEGDDLARKLVRAQLEIQRKAPGPATTELEKLAQGPPSLASSLARYWRGSHLLLSSDLDRKRDGILSLLSIAASDGAQPELAAAAVYKSALACEEVGNAEGAQMLRRELKVRHAATAFGTQSLLAGKKPRAARDGPSGR